MNKWPLQFGRQFETDNRTLGHTFPLFLLLDFFYQQQRVNGSFRRLDAFVSDIATCPLNGLVHRVAR